MRVIGNADETLILTRETIVAAPERQEQLVSRTWTIINNNQKVNAFFVRWFGNNSICYNLYKTEKDWRI